MSIEENKRSPVKKIFKSDAIGIIADMSKIKVMNISLEIGNSAIPKFFFKTKNIGIIDKAIKRSTIFIIIT
ncbi:MULTISPECIES: hypothetical protein [Methanobacterium]|jgi:hypothetical protein|uniref:Uncharacterized protein n=1 Tax=Methanobacterium subterraneum TaxID=59277 RepID=A0A7K4DMU2_9EURY|nr:MULTISPECIES: hypothetical protein [Methanobacterium]MBW4258369.1 hypothetical protein [Methanobacterium sp. YSL]NMO09793.1 hypothetical protein [Methanobacterium subterraneum]